MDSFSRVEQSDGRFNTIFCVSLSVCISVAVIGIITYFGFALVSYSWIIYALLVFAPVITYAIVRTQAAVYTMAYYKKWTDAILGVLDRRKILDEFKHKYKIDSLQAKANDIKADGRWHFKISTAHVRSLIAEKNSILLHLDKDRIDVEAQLNDRIAFLENELKKLNDEKATVEREEAILLEKLKNAKTSKEVYMQRTEYEIVRRYLNKCATKIDDANYEVTIAKHGKDKALKSYENSVKKTKDYLYLRFQNYTRSAVKTINMVNGLKYSIDDMLEDKK